MLKPQLDLYTIGPSIKSSISFEELRLFFDWCPRNQWSSLKHWDLILLKTHIQFSCSAVSDSLRAHESQHVRPPCPSPTHTLADLKAANNKRQIYLRPGVLQSRGQQRVRHDLVAELNWTELKDKLEAAVTPCPDPKHMPKSHPPPSVLPQREKAPILLSLAASMEGRRHSLKSNSGTVPFQFYSIQASRGHSVKLITWTQNK